MKAPEANLINSWLAGSPYSFPVDADGEAKAKALLQAQVEIMERQGAIRKSFSLQAADLRAELERDFDLRLVFESNAIEGVATSFHETQAFLRSAEQDPKYVSVYSFGQQVSADTKLLEVVGHGGALRFVRDLASNLQGESLREVDIRNIHRLAMASEPSIAGSYKLMDNSIAGRPDLLTAKSDDVSWHMNQLIGWLEHCKVQGPLAAVVVHAWLAMLHPFDDGNGRVARLLANYVLFRHGWPCLILRAGADRQQYYDALQQSDYGGDIAPLFSLFVEGLNRTLSEMAHPDFARSLLAVDLERQDAYETWTRMLTRFLTSLRGELDSRSIDVEVVGFIGPNDFAWLERRDPVGNAWWAKVLSRDRSIDLLLWLGYQSDELRSLKSDLRSMPSIFISERNRNPRWLHPYRPLWSDARLDVHEVSLQPRANRDRVVLRQGGTVSSLPMSRAANVVAQALAGLRTTT
jgi:Fic family protein